MKKKEGLSKDHQAIIGCIRYCFEKTVWSGFIKGFQSSSDPLSTFATYASNNWLSDVHISQMGELLLADLDEDPAHASKTFIISPYFATSFLHSDWTHPWTQRTAQDLTTGRYVRILGILNVNGNHWIAYVIDFEEETLSFGDSLGCYPDKSVISKFLAWIKNISAAKYLPFPSKKMDSPVGCLHSMPLNTT
jgi:hypothetical protein